MSEEPPRLSTGVIWPLPTSTSHHPWEAASSQGYRDRCCRWRGGVVEGRRLHVRKQQFPLGFSRQRQLLSEKALLGGRAIGAASNGLDGAETDGCAEGGSGRRWRERGLGAEEREGDEMRRPR